MPGALAVGGDDAAAAAMAPRQAVLIAYCRAGFERDAGAELAERAQRAGLRATVAAQPGTAFVQVATPAAFPRSPLLTDLGRDAPVFARSVIAATGPVALLPPPGARTPDRVTPIVASIAALAQDAACKPPWRSLWVEHPDTNEGKALSPLARALQARIEPVLRERGWLHEQAPDRLHVFLPDGTQAWVGTSTADTARWPLGIPRLRRLGGAPSRSAAKLAEALLAFLGEREHALLRAGLRAVDLGAAPGGWSWLLAQRGLRVTAVDNGPLKGAAAQDPLITHLRADGMTFRPPRPVDWLVCDIVEQPIRIADLVARWFAAGWARHAIFNLKLPMKRRHAEVARCAAHIAARLRGMPHTLALRHLYHDREEVTGYLAGPGPAPAPVTRPRASVRVPRTRGASPAAAPAGGARTTAPRRRPRRR